VWQVVRLHLYCSVWHVGSWYLSLAADHFGWHTSKDTGTHICQSKSLHMDSYQNPNHNPQPTTHNPQPTTHNHLSNNPTPPPTNLNFTILLLGWRLPAHRRGAFLYIKWSTRHRIGSCPPCPPSSWYGASLGGRKTTHKRIQYFWCPIW